MRKKFITFAVLVLAAAILAGCSAKGGYVPGVLEGDTYTNSYLGYSFTLPEGWSFATQEELDEMMVGADELIKEDMKEAYEYSKLATIYDMVAMDGYGRNIMVMLDNLKMYLGGMNTDEAQYIDTLNSQLSGISEEVVYQTVGYPYDISALGRQWKVLTVEAVDYGFYQTYCVSKLDNYMVAVIITSDDVVDISDLSDYFSEAPAAA